MNPSGLKLSTRSRRSVSHPNPNFNPVPLSVITAEDLNKMIIDLKGLKYLEKHQVEIDDWFLGDAGQFVKDVGVRTPVHR